MRKSIIDFLRDESGPTAVEYAVMLALIVVTCLGSIRLFGNTTASTFGDIRDAISGFMGGN